MIINIIPFKKIRGIREMLYLYMKDYIYVFAMFKITMMCNKKKNQIGTF